MQAGIPEINFHKIRAQSGRQDEGFEELCCQLLRYSVPVPDGSTFIRFRGAGGDGGVECVWQLPNGEEWGLQSKYFFELDKQQLDKSVSTALSIHPQLTKYFICIPFDLTGPTGRRKKTGPPEKSQSEKYLGYRAEWEALAKSLGNNVDFVLWSKSELITRLLSLEAAPSRIHYWFNQQLLSNEWFGKHLSEIVKTAEPRYTPDLTVDVPIHVAFEAFGKTSLWERSVTKRKRSISKVVEEWSDRLSSSRDPMTPPLPELAKDPVKMLIPLLEKITKLLESLIKSNDIGFLGQVKDVIQKAKEQASSCVSITIKSLEDEHGEGVADSEPFRQFMAEYQVSFPTAHVDLSKETLDVLTDLDTWFDDYGQLSIVSSAMVVGPAGIGKTHSICDIAIDRYKRGLQTVVLFGQHFTEGEPWEQIRQLLGLSTTLSRDEILGILNMAGEATGYPCILFIDAINESQPRTLWRNHIARFVEQVSRYRWLKLCFSCRSTYLDDILPDRFFIPQIIHKGFEGVEFDACFAFFKHYNLEPPSTPLMQPEFSNPLFLRLVCESLQGAGETGLTDKIFGLTEVINSLIANKEYKIAQVLDYNPREHIVTNALQLLLDRMRESQSRWLIWKDAKALCNTIWPAQQRSTSLFDQLLREGLLKEDRVADLDLGSTKDVVRFSFERLGDYLLAQGYLDGLDNQTVQDVFVQDGILFFSVRDSEAIVANLGLLEALAILLPEKFGLELTELVNNTSLSELRLAVIESIRWRTPSCITFITERIVKNALSRKETFNETMEMLISMSTRIEHRLNAIWFHNLAMSSPMPQRDAWLCPYLYKNYEDRKAVNRLIHWGLRIEASAVSDEIATLWATQLGWFCAASDRRVRDNATKAIINIMKGSEGRWPELIKRFSVVDDEYVLERILAAAYGSIVRNPEQVIIKIIAQSVYTVFSDNVGLPQNGMIRDYARLILEFALYKGLLPDGVELKQFQPPYESEWPVVIPNQEFIDQYEDSYRTLPKLYRSCFDDDFNSYTIETAIRSYNNIGVNDAARWIFKHVLDMGYSTNLHAGFDGYIVSRYGPGRSKPEWAERIGKKYQWIALYRLLARLGDHSEVKEDRWDPPLHNLQARSEKNIDPTLLIRSSKADDDAISWWSTQTYNFDAFNQVSDRDWLRSFDFPNSENMLVVKAPITDQQYYVLLARLDWSSRSTDNATSLL